MRPPDEVTIYSMVATPFGADGSLDLDAYAALLDRTCIRGVGVYLGSGGAAEGHALSLAELAALYRVGVDVCGGRVPVAANPRESRTAAATLELASMAVEAGVDRVQVYPLDPGHGMKPTPTELERYYRFVLERLDHPVALSVHSATPYPVSAAFVASLCLEFPRVDAVNVIMPMAYFRELQRRLTGHGRPIELYTSVSWLVDGLYAGSSGCLAAEPNLIPHTMRQLAEAVLAGDTATAAELHRVLYGLIDVAQRWAPSTARWLKMGLRVLDLPGRNGVLREPYVLPDEGEIDEMRRAFAELRVAEVEAACAARATS